MAAAAIIMHEKERARQEENEELEPRVGRLQALKRRLSAVLKDFGRTPSGEVAEEEHNEWIADNPQYDEDMDAHQQTMLDIALSTANRKQDNGPAYHLEGSIRNIEDWPIVKQGYLSLVGYMLFVMLFLLVLGMQSTVFDDFLVDRAYREGIVQQANQLEEVKSIFSMWTYLLGSSSSSGGATKKKAKKSRTKKKGGGGGGDDLGLIPQLFSETWYNDDPVDADASGFVLLQNKLVGGVLLVQERSKLKACPSSSLFSKFYTNCHGDVNADPFGRFEGHPEWCNSTNAHPDEALAGITGFCYSAIDKGYSQFLPVANGLDFNVALVNNLKSEQWVDRLTRSISVKFASYNGNMGLFTFVDIGFHLNKGGGFVEPINVVIQSVKMEPYSKPIDYFRAVLECILVMSIGYQVGGLLKGIFAAFQHGRGMKHLVNIWTMVDILNLTLFVISVAMRIIFVYDTFKNPIVVPTTLYKVEIEDAARLQRLQVSINAFNILLCMFRFFKFYTFQDRLSLLTDTFKRSWVDLYHFLIMFLVIFFGYSFIGYIVFGPFMFEYSAFDRALSAQYEMILNNYDFAAISRINPFMAALFLATFIFIVGILLINVLLAILVDAYTRAAERGDDEPPARSVPQQCAIAMHRLFSWLQTKQANAGNLSALGSGKGSSARDREKASTQDLLASLYASKGTSGKVTIDLLQSNAPPGTGSLKHKSYMLIEEENDDDNSGTGFIKLEQECSLLYKENQRLASQIETLSKKLKKGDVREVCRGWLRLVQKRTGLASKISKTPEYEKSVWVVATTQEVNVYRDNLVVNLPPNLLIPMAKIRAITADESKGRLVIREAGRRNHVFRMESGEEARDWAAKLTPIMQEFHRNASRIV